MSSTFPQARLQMVLLEHQTEAALTQYGEYALLALLAATGGELTAERAVDELLHKRDEVLAVLTRALELDKTLGAGKVSQVLRHREALANHWRDFGRIRLLIAQERNRLNLLFLVRSDIESHRQRTELANPAFASEEAYMAQESSRVGNANLVADRLLQTAYETRDELYRQRGVLTGAGLRLQGTLAQIPGINTVIGQISARRRRDALILSSLIVACIVLLWISA